MKNILYSFLLITFNTGAIPEQGAMVPEAEMTEKMNTAPSSPPDASESDKFQGTLRAKDAYPLSPDVEGKYRQSVGEEKQAEEERLIEDKDERKKGSPNGP